MELYLTFHKVLDKLQSYQEQNPALNSFGYGNLVDFGKNVSGQTVQYPLLFIVPQSVQYDENTTTYQLTAIVADRLNETLDNEKDAVSDCSIIARNLVSVIKRGFLQDYFETILPANALPFIERFNDNVAGVALDLNLIVYEDVNACIDYPSATPSNTPTNTPSGGAPSPTPTATVTETPTQTPTPSVTESPVPLPSVTPTETPTGTPTNTPTETPTNTPTNTPTPSSTPAAEAFMYVSVFESDNRTDVIWSGSGTFNTFDLTLVNTYTSFGSGNDPSTAHFGLGALQDVLGFTGATSIFPTNFGFNSSYTAPLDEGNYIGAYTDNQLLVSSGYTSGSQISGKTTYTGASITSLGLTPGTYYYSWTGNTGSKTNLILTIDSPLPSPTPSITPTNTPTETPTNTPTPSATPCVCERYVLSVNPPFSQNANYIDCNGVPSTIFITSAVTICACLGSVTSPSGGVTITDDGLCSVTPTPTSTPTSTPTNTPSNTPSVTPTNTPTTTVTESPIPSSTPSSTPTSTPSETPTNTPTPSVTETPTQTPTSTVTETPTNTPTNTQTPTPSVTETPTQTPTNTPSNTPSVTPTLTSTNTPTPSITPTSTRTGVNFSLVYTGDRSNEFSTKTVSNLRFTFLGNNFTTTGLTWTDDVTRTFTFPLTGVTGSGTFSIFRNICGSATYKVGQWFGRVYVNGVETFFQSGFDGNTASLCPNQRSNSFTSGSITISAGDTVVVQWGDFCSA